MKTKFIETRLFYPQCKNIAIIYRRISSQRKFGHLKKFYCWKCKEEINHIEIRDYNINLEELNDMEVLV